MRTRIGRCAAMGPVAVLCLAAFNLHAAISVSMAPSPASPAPVATVVTWTAAAGDDGPGPVWYRFRAHRRGGDWRVVRDFSLAASLDWTASDHDGSYELEVSARDTVTGESAVAIAGYEFTSRAGSGPVISPTANPLVFLYSAPPCAAQDRMRVEFQDPQGYVQYTPFQPCVAGSSMNFYVAGLRAKTAYQVKHTIDTGVAFEDGPPLSVTTPAVSLQLPPVQVKQAAASGGILLHSTLFGPPFATDLSGNVVWFYTGRFTFLTRPEPGGNFLTLIVDPTPDATLQILREVDLAGNAIRETNAARINQQLAALGLHPIGAFHHEATGLRDGGVLVLATTERILTNVQGPGPVDVLGDMILVLDRDLQVAWAWDAFDHLDTRRAATLGETCTSTTPGCPPLYLAPQANDWLHGNSLQFTPGGDILYSSRHQDWIMKIDYANGAGTGAILWRLGRDGDFQMISSDPNPWFSHQHGPELAPGSDSVLTVFDNGNLRKAQDSTAPSRGQALALNQADMTVTLVLNADLGGFSFALGSAQRLPDGDFAFGGGWLPDNTSLAREVDASGKPVYQARVPAPEYRQFRMADLYSPAGAPAIVPRTVGRLPRLVSPRQ